MAVYNSPLVINSFVRFDHELFNGFVVKTIGKLFLSLHKIKTFARISTRGSEYGNGQERVCKGGFSRNIQLFFSSPLPPFPLYILVANILFCPSSGSCLVLPISGDEKSSALDNSSADLVFPSLAKLG